MVKNWSNFLIKSGNNHTLTLSVISSFCLLVSHVHNRSKKSKVQAFTGGLFFTATHPPGSQMWLNTTFYKLLLITSITHAFVFPLIFTVYVMLYETARLPQGCSPLLTCAHASCFLCLCQTARCCGCKHGKKSSGPVCQKIFPRKGELNKSKCYFR